MDTVLQFTVSNQQIERTDEFTVVEGSDNYLRAQFTFTTPDWDGMIKTGVFISEDGTVHPSLCENDVCDVPTEWLVSQKGAVGVIGSDGITKITTRAATVRVRDKGYTGNGVDEDAMAGYFDQIMAAFVESKESVKLQADRAEVAAISAEAWAHSHEDHPDRAQDNAAYYAGQARADSQRTAEDRERTAHLAEIMAAAEENISADREAIILLKDQAQTAAGNALRSEQGASASKEAAEQFAASAEAAADQTAQDAQRTAEDRRAAEAAKGIILQIGQKVTEDKAAVEKTVSDFEALRQQAVSDVDNAGQAQTERVQGAWEQAVGDIAMAGSQALTLITDTGTAQTQAVNAAGAAQVEAIAREGTAQAQNVRQAAAEIIAERDQIERNRQNLLKTAIIRKSAGRSAAMADSAEMPFQGLRHYGRTTQETTTGGQLFDGTYTKDTALTTDGIESPYSGRSTSGFVKVNANTTYIGFTPWLRVVFYDAEKNTIDYSDETTEYRTTPDGTEFLRFNFINGEENNIMINKGTVKLPYEPYTGGQPSPNPDYPQELVNAGDKGNVEMVIAGKNLFSGLIRGVFINSSTGAEISASIAASTDYIRFDKDKQYYLSGLSGKLSSFVFAYDENKNPIARIGGNARTDILLSAQPNIFSSSVLGDIENIAYIRVTQYVNNSIDGSTIDLIDSLKVQLEEGTEPTIYEPYRPFQRIIVFTPNGLPGIPVSSGGNYTDENGQQWACDEIDAGRGVYVQRIKEYVLDGSQTIYGYRALINDNGYAGYIVTGDRDKSIREILCTHLKFISFNQSNSMEYGAIIGAHNNTPIWMTFSPQLETAEAAQTYLADCYASGSPVIVRYVLATPIETPIPPEELAAYRELHTNYPSTTIHNDEDCWMEVEYVADPENHIAQNYAAKENYAALEHRVSALEAQAVKNI